jgi:hypothetical protein
MMRVQIPGRLFISIATAELFPFKPVVSSQFSGLQDNQIAYYNAEAEPTK